MRHASVSDEMERRMRDCLISSKCSARPPRSRRRVRRSIDFWRASASPRSRVAASRRAGDAGSRRIRRSRYAANDAVPSTCPSDIATMTGQTCGSKSCHVISASAASAQRHETTSHARSPACAHRSAPRSVARKRDARGRGSPALAQLSRAARTSSSDRVVVGHLQPERVARRMALHAVAVHFPGLAEMDGLSWLPRAACRGTR